MIGKARVDRLKTATTAAAAAAAKHGGSSEQKSASTKSKTTTNGDTSPSSSATSSNSSDDHRSLCSRVSSTDDRDVTAARRKRDDKPPNRASMSDPSTNIHSPKRPAAAAKQLFFDIAQFDKYSTSKDGTSGAATTAAAALPTVSAPRSLTQSPAAGRSINANRRVVNIVYSSFNKQGGAGAAARAGRGGGGAPTTSGLNVLGEKASVGRAGGAVGRSSLDAASSKTSKSERFQPSTAHRKLTLPTISPPAAQLLRKAGHQTS